MRRGESGRVRSIGRIEGTKKAAAGRRVAVLMSGGVDSAASAVLLLRQGYDVAGLTMRIPDGSDSETDAGAAVEGARALARLLGIPHVALDVADEFRAFVTEPFRGFYASGRTPNPCSDCNARVKFGLLMDYAERELGSPLVATGHYARILKTGGECLLARADDRSRDQSYFLAGIPRERLDRILFPLGGRSKDEARALAAEAGLPVATAADSMEICFVGQGDYRQAVSDLPHRPGPFVAEDGRVLGRHEGIPFYTVGQRKGLGLALPEPLYISRIDPETNEIVLVPRKKIFRECVEARDVNVLLPDAMDGARSLTGKVRSQGEPLPCRIAGFDGNTLRVVFDPPVFAPAPGQRLVLYDGDTVAAGGVITNGGASS